MLETSPEVRSGSKEGNRGSRMNTAPKAGGRSAGTSWHGGRLGPQEGWRVSASTAIAAANCARQKNILGGAASGRLLRKTSKAWLCLGGCPKSSSHLTRLSS